jgi:hypothetical protein
MTDRPIGAGVNRLQARHWRDMSSAPRDGRFVLLTWMENGEPQEIFPMRRETDATNDTFAPGVRGMWVVPGGSLTWTEDDPQFGPTHWAPEFDA